MRRPTAEAAWHYLTLASWGGVALMAASLPAGGEAGFWVGLVLAVPVYLYFAAVAMILVAYFALAGAAVALMAPVALAAAGWSALARRAAALRPDGLEAAAPTVGPRQPVALLVLVGALLAVVAGWVGRLAR